jgi:hypothetical protein
VPLGALETVVGSGFAPGEQVVGTLHSTPVDLGSVRADADGRATFTVAVPHDLESGQHHVVLAGASSGRTGAVGFVVPGGRRATVFDLSGPPLLAAVLGLPLLLSVAVVALTHRRRRSAVVEQSDQVVAVPALLEWFGGPAQPVVVEPAVAPGDLLDAPDLEALPLLDHRDELRRLPQ